ncbi:sulfatase-like hydrolase/transferase [Pseudorhodobacter sp.]|uniref:sulfatase-like hydrolase/transferase n=1 Tax=Pseudorhodobacter sp. TaxID=1934400 RepID=UPI002649576F|nr:sulfatase-like hydrolase/transferase [Pseudorhodobacter sp.]MDN5785619.1 sulfatase-like hydrolase/transferase [Pseudorhodobacter sp.]
MTEPRPNIVLVVMDDCNSYWHYKAAFGEQLQTPNLDRICAVSTAFHTAYCQVAACGPSRASMMSGLAPHQTGVFDTHRDIFGTIRPDQMWSYRLKQSGYYCSSVGKVHHGYRPLLPQNHDPLYSHPSVQLRFGPRANAAHKDFGGGQVGIGTTDPNDDQKYYDYQSASSAITFFEQYDKDAPFYREIGFHNPHIPLKTPARFKEMYDDTKFEMPPEWKGWRDLNAQSRNSFGPNINLAKEEFWQKTLRNYFSAISHVDWQIGRVWDALQASAHAKDTVFIITADHGYHVGDKNRFRKFSLWEEADGVPLIIHDPTLATGQTVEDPVALLDIGPTVLDYAGLPPIVATAGRSLRAQVQGKAVEGRAIPSFFFGAAGVRQGNCRYIRYMDGGTQFVDLDADPWQLADGSQDHPQRATMEEAHKAATQAFGLTMIAPGEVVVEPALYVTTISGAQAPLSPPTLGVISYDPPDMATQDVPGNRRYYIRHQDDMTLHMPGAYRILSYACDVGAPDKQLNVACHDRGSHVDLVATHRRCILHVEGGRGDDCIETLQDPLTARLHAGNNVVRTGVHPSTIHCGAGRDEVHCRSDLSKVIGGAGDVAVIATGKATEVQTGAGRNQITCQSGEVTITLGRGQTDVEIAEKGTATLIFRRSGLPNIVRGFDKGRLDFADWLKTAEMSFSSEGSDSVVICGMERVVFVGCSEKTVRAAIR